LNVAVQVPLALRVVREVERELIDVNRK
jgi:hypothetical protein